MKTFSTYIRRKHLEAHRAAVKRLGIEASEAACSWEDMVLITMPASSRRRWERVFDREVARQEQSS